KRCACRWHRSRPMFWPRSHGGSLISDPTFRRHSDRLGCAAFALRGWLRGDCRHPEIERLAALPHVDRDPEKEQHQTIEHWLWSTSVDGEYRKHKRDNLDRRDPRLLFSVFTVYGCGPEP